MKIFYVYIYVFFLIIIIDRRKNNIESNYKVQVFIIKYLDKKGSFICKIKNKVMKLFKIKYRGGVKYVFN